MTISHRHELIGKTLKVTVDRLDLANGYRIQLGQLELLKYWDEINCVEFDFTPAALEVIKEKMAAVPYDSGQRFSWQPTDFELCQLEEEQDEFNKVWFLMPIFLIDGFVDSEVLV